MRMSYSSLCVKIGDARSKCARFALASIAFWICLLLVAMGNGPRQSREYWTSDIDRRLGSLENYFSPMKKQSDLEPEDEDSEGSLVSQRQERRRLGSGKGWDLKGTRLQDARPLRGSMSALCLQSLHTLTLTPHSCSYSECSQSKASKPMCSNVCIDTPSFRSKRMICIKTSQNASLDLLSTFSNYSSSTTSPIYQATLLNIFTRHLQWILDCLQAGRFVLKTHNNPTNLLRPPTTRISHSVLLWLQ